MPAPTTAHGPPGAFDPYRNNAMSYRTDEHRCALPHIGGRDERRTAYTWRSCSFAGANDSLRARSTRPNHSHPAVCGCPESERSTRGSCVDRAPIAHTNSTVAPKPPSQRCWLALTAALNVSSCKSGKCVFIRRKYRSTSVSRRSAGGKLLSSNTGKSSSIKDFSHYTLDY